LPLPASTSMPPRFTTLIVLLVIAAFTLPAPLPLTAIPTPAAATVFVMVFVSIVPESVAPADEPEARNTFTPVDEVAAFVNVLAWTVKVTGPDELAGLARW